MINFVEIPLHDPSYLNEHDELDRMLSEGWQIIGHAVYVFKSHEHQDDAYERYTLYKADMPQDIRLEETSEEIEAAYEAVGKSLSIEGSS